MTPYGELDLLDERITGRYPRSLRLNDGTEITLTPMVPSDWPMLRDFLQSTPARDRKFFRHDLSDEARVERWCSGLDYRHILPLLGWMESRIVADAALQQEPGLWTAHVGKLRILLHPDFRHRGLGTQLVHEMIEVARQFGLHKLVHECAAEQADLISLLESVGFRQAARLPDFIRDRDGQFHEMVLMELAISN